MGFLTKFAISLMCGRVNKYLMLKTLHQLLNILFIHSDAFFVTYIKSLILPPFF